ncbi:hemoblobin-interacting domain-containing protein, partial [Floccifex sp.]|uniref:hemoblobin-interacting domain-containing protein n=1 Tax=Floccifex sp. TaxID=2815810 RepID=UPI003F02F95D
LKHISAKDATVTEEGNKEYWQCTVCEKYFSDENGTNEILFDDIVISKLAPEIIKGKGQSVTQGEKKALSFTSNASIDDFKYVKLDGKELDSSKYTVKSGSIVVTLKSDFVSTLKVGKHTISIVSESGEATTEFEVIKKEVVKDTSKKDNSNKTNTGIIGNVGLWISMMVSSLDALLIGFVLKKKKMK